MDVESISLHDWLQTPPGQYLAQWEQRSLDRAVADVFGYHAMQLGLPAVDALNANRMPHRCVVGAFEDGQGQHKLSVLTDFSALPFASGSVDLMVLPHTLEFSGDPHATLREVERVLVPEGRVVICGFNPMSLWALRHQRARWLSKLGLGQLYLPADGEFIGYWRIRDWLRLLNFEVESGQFGCFRPAVRSEAWLNRWDWLDPIAERWWPLFGAAYCVTAAKRVPGMRLMGPSWKVSRRRAAAAVPVANRQLEPSAGSRRAASASEPSHEIAS